MVDEMGLMSLKNIHLPATMDTSSADTAVDFYAPALSVSVRYDRGVGFFSSGWLRVAAQGLLPFAANGGQADQLVLFVTDEELRDQARQNLNPHIGAEYRLNFDKTTSCTSIDEV